MDIKKLITDTTEDSPVRAAARAFEESERRFAEAMKEPPADRLSVTPFAAAEPPLKPIEQLLGRVIALLEINAEQNQRIEQQLAAIRAAL